jgi:DNA-binding NarL/FixJ family response regulator
MEKGRDMRVLLADDYPLFLEGLKNLLTIRGIEEVGTARDGILDADLPDVILFDLTAVQAHFAIPLMHAHPTIQVIGIDVANNKMLVLSGKQSCLLTAEDLVQAIQAGALK